LTRWCRNEGVVGSNFFSGPGTHIEHDRRNPFFESPEKGKIRVDRSSRTQSARRLSRGGSLEFKVCTRKARDDVRMVYGERKLLSVWRRRVSFPSQRLVWRKKKLLSNYNEMVTKPSGKKIHPNSLQLAVIFRRVQVH